LEDLSMNHVSRKRLLGLASVAVLIWVSIISAAASWAQQPNRVPVLIGFNHQPGPAEEALVRRAGGSIKFTYHLVRGIAATLPGNAIDALRRNPNVTSIEPDGLFHKIDMELDNTWGVKRIGAGTVHDSGNKGLGVTVAIIDSGIDYTHPDLGGCLGESCKIAGGSDFVNNDDDPMDDDGHGTHVAGTVAANEDSSGVVGVAPEATLYALKVLNASGSGSFSDVIKALEWVVDNGIKITNNSYGSSGDPGTLVKAAFDNSYAAGVLHIAAAGNSGNCRGKNDSVGYPAKYASVVAVAATNSSDNRPCWSSTGPDVELSAPGVSINSTKMGGGYIIYSGTSMASPHVAGVAALVLGTNASLATTEVRQILTSTAQDLGAAGRDTLYGYGLVDAVAAVGAVSSPITPTPAVNVTVNTDKSSYSGSDTDAILTAVVKDEYGSPITNLNSSAFDTTVDGGPTSVAFSETATGGTYAGTLALSELAATNHNVTVTVTDNSVSGSGSTSFSIQLVSAATTASVSSITYATTGGKHNDKHLNITVTVNDNLGNVVSGASVSINLSRNGSVVGSGSGTTGSSGTVTFVYSNAPPGTYSTEVTNVVAVGLSWDGNTPANSFTKN
jgi:subtilisin